MVLERLHQELAEWHASANEADRTSEASQTDREIPSPRNRFENVIIEIQGQIDQQQQQRDDIIDRREAIQDGRDHLCLKRDYLQARLRVVQSRKNTEDRQDSRRMWSVLLGGPAIVWVIFTVCLLVGIILFANRDSLPFLSAVFDPDGDSHPSSAHTNSLGMKFVTIPRGTFWMGADAGEIAPYLHERSVYQPDWNEGEQPKHSVHITKPFFMGQQEVTVGQFRAFVEETSYRTNAEQDGIGGVGWSIESIGTELRSPKFNWKNPGFIQTDQHPVVNVTWNDATAFCEWLSRKEGVTYRLPTEAEWEYACRAGTTTPFSVGSNGEDLAKVGNVCDESLRIKFGVERDKTAAIAANDGFVFTAPVGQFEPNAFHLFDMHGNVQEWCLDWHTVQYYQHSPPQDPLGPIRGEFRVFRGSSWLSTPIFCRSANRSRYPPNYCSNKIGFRVVRESSSKD